MSNAQPITASTHPVFRHPKRPDWGMAIVSQDLPDLLCMVFESGRTAKFFKTALPTVEVEVSDSERATLYARLRRSLSPASEKRTPAKKAKVALYEPTSFEQQLSIFAGMYAGGFADPEYVGERAGNKGLDAAIALADDVLSKAKLAAAIDAGKFGDVLAAAVSVAKAAPNMAHPQFEVAPLAATAADQQEKLARALVALLHGTGDEAERFDAFVASLASPFWTIATVFTALRTPQASFFAKPKIEQRQAKLLGIEEPPGGVPSHAGYLRYLAVGTTVRDRLVAAGVAPKDLLDVYAFIALTLSAKPAKIVKPKVAKASKEPKAEAEAEPQDATNEADAEA